METVRHGKKSGSNWLMGRCGACLTLAQLLSALVRSKVPSAKTHVGQVQSASLELQYFGHPNGGREEGGGEEAREKVEG